MFINVLEDLKHHEVMRRGLQRQVRYLHFADHISRFLAHTLFYSSDFFLGSSEKKARLATSTNPVLCKVTEDLIFTHPWVDHPSNNFDPVLRSIALQLWQRPIDMVHWSPSQPVTKPDF